MSVAMAGWISTYVQAVMLLDPCAPKGRRAFQQALACSSASRRGISEGVRAGRRSGSTSVHCQPSSMMTKRGGVPPVWSAVRPSLMPGRRNSSSCE